MKFDDETSMECESSEDVGADALAALLRGQSSGARVRTADSPLASLGGGVIVGQLLTLDSTGNAPVVHHESNGQSHVSVARTTVDLNRSQIGCSVVICFEGGDVDHPIVIGALRGGQTGRLASSAPHLEVVGDRAVLEAGRELVLRCGAASITLTCAGKVLVSGTYVSVRSTGVNRITGGSVQIN